MEAIRVLNGEYCLAFTAIANIIGSIDYVKNALRRNREGSTSWVHFPDPHDKRKQWIVYKTLPEITKIRVDQQIGDIETAYWTEQFSQNLWSFIHPDDSSFFLAEFAAQDAARKVRACAFLRMLSAGTLRDKFKTEAEYYSRAAKVSFEDPLNSLSITNPRTLKRKVEAFESEGPGCLIHGLVGCENAAKLTSLGRDFIVACYASPLKPSMKKVAELYNREAATREGWAIITEERVRQILRESQVSQLTFASRHGVAAARNEFERTIKRRKPSRPDALWCLDGFTTQLRYRSGSEIRSDLYAVMVLDVYSLKIIGWKLGMTETATLVQGALRAACRSTMMRPEQLQYDNSSANKSGEAKQLFDRVAGLAFPTAPYNGKSKQIEAVWGGIEGRIMHGFGNFKGGNITSPSLQSKANPDFLSSQELPDLYGTIDQVKLLVAVYNETKGEDGRTPNERYTDHQDKRVKLGFLQMVEAFWVLRKYPARYTKDGLTIEVNEERYTYEVESEAGIEDMEWRKEWLGTSFEIKYDPEYLDSIVLYSEGKYVAVANRKYEAPMARLDMQEGDGTIIRKALKERNRYIDESLAAIDELKDRLVEANLPGELDFNILNKDALNRVERQLQDEVIDRTAIRKLERNAVPKSERKRYNIYDVDEDADSYEITDY